MCLKSSLERVFEICTSITFVFIAFTASPIPTEVCVYATPNTYGTTYSWVGDSNNPEAVWNPKPGYVEIFADGVLVANNGGENTPYVRVTGLNNGQTYSFSYKTTDSRGNYAIATGVSGTLGDTGLTNYRPDGTSC